MDMDKVDTYVEDKVDILVVASDIMHLEVAVE
jgi:hypothetical protein